MISRRNFGLVSLTVMILILLFGLSGTLVNAGNVVLSGNKGDTSKTWFITGEQTLVINGFDLAARSITRPAVIDKVSIDVEKPIPGSKITVVIYQDANGGSPIDATLAGQASIDITQPGLFTATLPTPAQITQPVVWVGFYLPVGFGFRADLSGSSVLTYWGWTPNSTFDLTKLNTAQVFGPGDGSTPVNIAMGGIARVTAEITGGATVPAQGTPGAPTTQPIVITTTPGVAVTPVPQVAGSGSENLNVLKAYPPDCDALLQDTADIGVSYRGRIGVVCKTIWPGYSPANPPGYVRKQTILYDLTIYTDKGLPVSDPLQLPVTHCLAPAPEDLATAVMGLATGSPRKWQVLPTLRVNNLVCAEIYQSGNVSYFVPG
jgi:hypothetical protein